jgi:hypothetical protein
MIQSLYLERFIKKYRGFGLEKTKPIQSQTKQISGL